jgi:hypothetical protein
MPNSGYRLRADAYFAKAPAIAARWAGVVLACNKRVAAMVEAIRVFNGKA